jgi:predicted AlkP superfamily pyrophosphatase or phosphodiesterase
MRRLVFLATAATLSFGAGPLWAQPQTGSAKPSLVVVITVDQMRPDYVDLFSSQLTGGLARLAKGGAVFTDAFQDHGITETAPGHASILSGRFPRSTGIVANNAGVYDSKAPLLGASGPTAEPASPFRFRGTTLFDWMRHANPDTRALSVSRKDRGAILPLGSAKGNVFWYATNGTFTTSTYYRDTLPGWVSAFNARRIPQSYAGKVWDLLLPASAYQEPDSVEFESSGSNFVFPHPFPADPERAAAVFAAYPAMDSLTFQFALAGLDALELGKSQSHTDLLAVSVSTTDAVGHRFGPDSREMHDQILRLDRYIGAFIDSLYRIRDSSRIVFALTSDHGVAPIPEAGVRTRYRSKPGGRVDVIPVVRALYQSLAAAKVDTSAYAWDDGFLVLEPEGFAKARVNRDSVARAFAAAVAKVPGVLRADLVSDLARRDTTKDVIARRWLRMFPPGLSAAVTLTLKPFWFRGTELMATHGSPHDYDAHVPLIFYGPWIKPGRYGEFSRVVDIAPTLAAIVGVRPLERLDGHVLQKAIR